MSSGIKRAGALMRGRMPQVYAFLKRYESRVRQFADQVREAGYIRRKSFMPGTLGARFAEQYFTDSPGGKAPAKEGIIVKCDGRMLHGGLTDRMRGILTVYREARRRGIPLHISWTSPFELEDYLQPATFDWRISDPEISDNLQFAYPVIIDDLPGVYTMPRLDAALHHRKCQTIVYTNADNARGHYRELYREVFRPSAALQAEVDRHLAVLGSGFHVYTFRFLDLLGDFRDCIGKELPEAEAEALMRKVEDEFRRLLRGVPADVRVLCTSDSRRFLDRIAGIDSRIYVVGGEVRNIDREQEEHRGAWMKTFVDQQLIMHASEVTLMRTGGMYQSGFPRFAAEIGGAKFRDHQFC